MRINSFHRLVGCITLLVFSAGCAIGPNYKRPNVANPTRWKWNEAAGPEGLHPPSRWWLIFNDPMLNSLEERALSGSQTLAQAASNVMQARAKARGRAADFFPTVNADPAYSRRQGSTEIKLPTGQKPTQRVTIDDFYAPLDLSYEVDIWGKVRRYFESARSDAVASQEEYNAVLLSLTADVAQTYFLIRVLDTHHHILEEAIDLRQESLEVSSAKYHAGLVSEIDVARAEYELANTQSELADSVRQRRQAENLLAILLGLPPTDFDLSAKIFSRDIRPPSVPAGLPSDILKRRPDVAKAEAQLRSENALIGVAVANFFPVVRLTGSAGFESSDLANLFTWNARSFSFGPSVSLPIFEAGRNWANYKASTAARDAAVANYRQQILVSFREVEDALVDLKQKTQQSQFQDHAVTSAERAVALSRERYDRGLVNYLEVLDAQRSLLQVNLDAARTLGERLTSTVHLIKAIGGGWDA